MRLYKTNNIEMPSEILMSEEATVLIVDEDEAVRGTMAALVRSKGLQVREFKSAEEFLAGFQRNGPMCLLLELRLPGMSGLELQQRLNASGESIPTVMFSGFGDIATAVQAMQQGAVTFLQKPCQPDDLWASIELALQRSNQQRIAAKREQALRDRFAKLSASERDVLARVMEGQPNKLIATELDLGLRTVELRRSNIMRKTGAGSLTDLIRLAIAVGFPKDISPSAATTEKDLAESA